MNNVIMEKIMVFYANPNENIDIRKFTRHAKKLSTKFSVDQDSLIDISNDLSEDGTRPLCEVKDQGSQKVVCDTRK